MDKEKLAEFHRENILQAADKLFLQYGFEKTTVEMLVKASKYSKPTLYVYFQSKEEIYACLLTKYMRLLGKTFDSVLCEKAKTAEVYLRCCHALAAFYRDYPVYFQGITGFIPAVKSGAEGVGDNSAVLGKSINEKFAALLSRAKAEGYVKNVDAALAYAHIWSCVTGLITSEKLRRQYGDDTPAYEKALDRCFMWVLEGFLKD